MTSSFNKNIKVLVVDDEDTSSYLNAGILRKFGIQTHTARCAEEAIGMTKNQEFDLVMMDIEMPERDGLEASRLIRQEGIGGEDIKIIALSGKILSKEHVQKCLDSGMNDCLVKPLERQVLITRLQKWFPPKQVV